MSRIVHTSRSFALLAGLVMVGSVAVVPAMAGTITYNFTGTVNVDGVGGQLVPPPNPVPFGDSGAAAALIGTMTVNTSGNHSSLPNGGSIGTYTTITNFDLHIGDYHATFGPGGGAVTIRNGTGNGAGGDRFLVTANVNGDSVGNRDPRVFTINLRGPASGPENVFSSDALPDPAPSVSSFITRNVFRLQFGNGNGVNRAVIGVMDTLTAVPLPSAVILFGVGLVALIGLGAGGLRNLRLPQA